MFKASRLFPFAKSTGMARCAAEESRFGARRRGLARILRLECLEERRVPSRYTVVDLGSLGGNFGAVGGINNSGEVVGGSVTATGEHAFLFSHGKMKDLGTLGGANSEAFGINNSAEVVGLSATKGANLLNAVFLYRHGHMVDLGAVDPYNYKSFDNPQINDRGDMVGFPLSDGDAALVRGGKFIDLGELATFGSATRDLNNRDEVVGYSAVSVSGSNLIYHAFLYAHGKMKDLGTLGGSFSQSNAINNHGEVTGDSQTASRAIHAFVYNHGHMTDLGAPSGAQTEADAINDRGEVVGTSYSTTSTATAGFLYENGKMIDLNSLIPAGSRFRITGAHGINNHGQIAANAVSTNPQDRTFYVVLLNPKSGAH
jgi:probable HAF family extracellular repeat protein